MKIPRTLPSRMLLAVATNLLLLPAAALWAQDLTPPRVANALPDLSVDAGATQNVINLKNTFALKGVNTGTIVRMATVLGNIDIEMLLAEAPKNVANFLSYVNSGEYNKTFIHRSVVVPTPFVVQGGGYSLNSDGQPVLITPKAPVVGEHHLSNTRGTLALALSTGPNSGTSEWFFNLAENTNLDGTLDGGPFTVFGRVIEAGMKTLDAIAALPTQDFGDGSSDDPFADVPLYHYNAAKGFVDSNLVYLNKVDVIPLVPAAPGGASVMKLKIANSNPALVTATISGRKLKLTYHSGETGSARIKVTATDSAGSSAKSAFTATVK